MRIVSRRISYYERLMTGAISKVKQTVNAFWRRWEATDETINRNSSLVVAAASDAKKEFTATDRKKLMRLSRHLRDNLGITAGLVTEISRYSVGNDVMIQALTENEDWNNQAEEYFLGWCEMADLRGQLTFGQMIDVWCQSMLVDGDVFALKTEHRDGTPAIQTIYGHSVEGDKDNWIDGVRYDAQWRPMRYQVEGRSVSASALRHIVEPRPNRLRGVPGIAHAANNLFDYRDILSFEKQGVKLNSSIAIVLKRAQQNATGNRFLSSATQSVSGDTILTLEQVLGGAQIPQIGLNDDVKIHQSDKTTPTFTGFLEHLIRDTAIGYGVPYEFAWSAEKLGGTSQRFIMAKAQRRFDQIRHVFAPHIRAVREYVIGDAIAKGNLPPQTGFWKCKLIWPKSATVDFGRDTRADLEKLKSGYMTLEDYHAAEQKDWRQQIDQIASEREYLREKGLSCEEIAGNQTE